MKPILQTLWSAMLVTLFIVPMFLAFVWLWAGLGLLDYVERQVK